MIRWGPKEKPRYVWLLPQQLNVVELPEFLGEKQLLICFS